MSKEFHQLLIASICLLVGAGFFIMAYFVPRENFWLTFSIYTSLFAGMLAVYFLRDTLKWFWIFIAGLIIRVSLIVAIPTWSDDYPRFLWDGELLKMCGNPYLETPEQWLKDHSETANPYLENLHELMNSPAYFSVYPPLNQAIFYMAAEAGGLDLRQGIIAVRTILIFGEIGVFLLFLKLFDYFQFPAKRLILYWLNPLVIMEITGNLHFEGLVLLFLLASLYALRKNRMLLSGGFWGLSAGMKLLPLMLFPSFLTFEKTRKTTTFWIGLAIALILSFGWFLIDNSWLHFFQSLKLYQGKFEFNASIYYLLREVGFWVKGYNIIGEITPILSGITLVGILYFSWKRKPENLLQLTDLWVLLYLVYLILQPVVHPWYLVPVFGLSLFTDKKAFLIWTFAVIFSYEAYGDPAYQENPIFLFSEYSILFFTVYWDYFKQNHKKDNKYMNYKSLFSFIFPLLIFSCTSSPEKEAQKLIKKSIEAHQLSKNWDDVAAVKFKKMSRLLDENGAVEAEFEQWVEFRLKPYFEGKLTWEKDSVIHVSNFNGSRMSYHMGENAIENAGFLKSKRAEIDAVFFAFAQPWNMIGKNANLTYEDGKTLGNGDTVESVRVTYGSDSDVSWIYFNPNSGKVVANEMQAKNHKNLIETISYDESTGLVLPREQKSYRIDVEGKKLFLQAKYVYSDYRVTFE